MTPEVYVAGIPVQTLTPVSELVMASQWPDASGAGIGGPVGASFSLLLPSWKRPGWLTKGAIAEIGMGGLGLLAGRVSEVDWESGTISIDGAATEGATTLCLNSIGETSSTVDTVIDAAIARGALTWNRPTSIWASPLTPGDTTEDLNYVPAMLEQFAQLWVGRMYVDHARSLRVGFDPLSPEFIIEAGAGELPWVSEDQATRLAGRWQDSTGARFTTFVGSGDTERAIDMTELGPQTSTTATAILTSILTQSTSGGWGGGIAVTSNQFIGAQHLGMVFEAASRGLMVRNLGQRDPRPEGLPTLGVDFIVERAEWHVADNVIVLTPRGMVARDFASILADAGVQEAA